MLGVLKRLGNDKRGTSSVEYGFILATIVLAIMGALQGFADESIGMWNNIAEKSDEAINGTD
jgi:pilus assembly protein Flp/PilA